MPNKTKPSFSQFGNLPEATAFVKSQPNWAEADLQLFFAPAFFPPGSDGNGFSIALALVSPQSHRHLELRSSDPTQRPAIFGNYFADTTDQQRFLKGMKLMRRLAQPKAFAPF